MGVLQFPEGDFFGRKIWQVFFLVWLQLGRDFRDKSRLYCASKIRSRLVLRLLEYSIYCKCIWCPGVGILPMEVNFFPSLFVCLFFFGGGRGGGGGGGVEALEMIFGGEGEGDFCFHSTTLFAQSPQYPSG